ncbi:hypothetical protein ATE92_1314 [Ulvibacter sp. MAR_2010_11]|uniref:hypothetical protein n=1 Tax=Ulvibacter sp. MAR_2010_11 TaxID=1250229 RepID=UPI000C2C4EB1|nr:hypothetical protein [Ulvibacter sp. MAR_2010_11]PKA83166.1 hypothetical protein ATE92_1314 [Ulvibacter sp. MAR_2010_11]
MKYFLTLLLIAAIIGSCIGFYIRTEDPKTGEFLIGISIAVTFFITMPVFIYHRWKNRSVKDYMLTRENIEKMKDYSRDKKL